MYGITANSPSIISLRRRRQERRYLTILILLAANSRCRSINPYQAQCREQILSLSLSHTHTTPMIHTHIFIFELICCHKARFWMQSEQPQATAGQQPIGSHCLPLNILRPSSQHFVELTKSPHPILHPHLCLCSSMAMAMARPCAFLLFFLVLFSYDGSGPGSSSRRSGVAQATQRVFLYPQAPKVSSIVSSKYRTAYHFQPPKNWINGTLLFSSLLFC